MTNEEQFKKLSKQSQNILLALQNSIDMQMCEDSRKLLSYDKYFQSLLVKIKEEYSYNELYKIAHNGNIINMFEEANNDVENTYERIADLEYEVDQLSDICDYFPVETLYDIQKIEILQKLYRYNLRELEELEKIEFNTNKIIVSCENDELGFKFSSTLETHDDSMISYIKEKFYINEDSISIIAKMVNDEIIKQVKKLGETKSIDAVEETKRILNEELNKVNKK